MGSSSNSSSASTQSTTTQNIDKRQVIAEGALGFTTDAATVNVTTLDGGIVQSALDVVKSSDAVSGAGFDKLLTLADKVFTAAQNQNDQTLKQIDAINTTSNNAKGTIDQKTLIILGLAGIAAIGLKKA